MNPRLKKLLLGIQVFTLACNKANANTKGLVYLQDGALVKPYLALMPADEVSGRSFRPKAARAATLPRRLGLPDGEYLEFLPPARPGLHRPDNRFQAESNRAD